MKTIIVTGASRGIGRAIAIRLLSEGERVLLIARDREKLDEIVNEFPGMATAFPVDLADLDNYSGVLDTILTHFPQIDGIVHNAGTGIFGDLEKIDFAEWRKQLDVNLNAAVLATQKILPGMKERHFGHIIFINSVAAGKIFSGGISYGVSKAALKMFANSLREELRSFNISVSSIYPAATATDWWQGSNFAANEMLHPEWIANAVHLILTAEYPAVIEDLTIRRIQGDF